MIPDAEACVGLDVVARELAEPRPTVEEAGPACDDLRDGVRAVRGRAIASASWSARSASGGSGSSTVSGMPCGEKLTGRSDTT